MNKGLKVFIIVLVIAAFFGLGYTIASKRMTANNKSNQQDVEANTNQSNSQAENSQNSENTSMQKISIDKWKLNIPNEFKEDKKDDAPWYEKKYVNDKGVSLIFGYYEPNGIDDRDDKQIFEEAVSEYNEDLKEAYGAGNITHKDINEDKMCSTVYYKTEKQRILTKSIIKDKVWKTITVQLPLSENEKDYENILDNIM